MTSRSKEKIASAFRNLFRSNRKVAIPDAAVGGAGAPGTTNANNATDSPARRLLRHVVQPIDAAANSGSAPRTRNDTTAHQIKVRSRRLMKELKDLQRVQTDSQKDLPFSAELVNDNLFEWHIRLNRVDPESMLAADMRQQDVPFILLHVTFPENYPFQPPFMRVVSPTIEKGFVMEGGAICMELLTPSGWTSAYTIEAVVMQFAASLVKGMGRIGKKAKSRKEFSQKTAEESFRSLVKTHNKYGWVTPPLSDG